MREDGRRERRKDGKEVERMERERGWNKRKYERIFLKITNDLLFYLILKN
jgi:hypothetical protein